MEVSSSDCEAVSTSISTIQKKWASPVKNTGLLEREMELTFKVRRKEILECSSSIGDILAKYPALQSVPLVSI